MTQINSGLENWELAVVHQVLGGYQPGKYDPHEGVDFQQTFEGHCVTEPAQSRRVTPTTDVPPCLVTFIRYQKEHVEPQVQEHSILG